MYDKDLVQDILNQILNATRTIQDRFVPIKSVDDFTNTPAGMEKLDAICMLVIAVGESLKKAWHHKSVEGARLSHGAEQGLYQSLFLHEIRYPGLLHLIHSFQDPGWESISGECERDWFL